MNRPSQILAALLATSTLVCSSAGFAQVAADTVGRTAETTHAPRWPSEPAAPKGAPNVLLIMTDDVGYGVTSAYGGPVDTPNFEALAKQEGKTFEEFEKEFFRKVRPTSLIKRFAKPEETASLVAYVASPLSSATTGAALRVDGGVVKSAF